MAPAARAGCLVVFLAVLQACLVAGLPEASSAAASPTLTTAAAATGRDRRLLAAAKPKCSPSLLQVAEEQGQLRQLVQLAAAGYDIFESDSGKPFTVLAPSDGALQLLAADTADEDQQFLMDGFYSVVLFNQIPQGAFNASQLVTEGTGGFETTLGMALNKKYEVSFDNKTGPVVATGGWPGNNAQLLSSHPACDGWLHIVDAVLLPTRELSNLPRLVDNSPDSEGSLWLLLAGGNASWADAPPAAAAAAAPAGDRATAQGGAAGSSDGAGGATGGTSGAGSGGGSSGDGQEPTRHSEQTEVVVSSGGAGNSSCSSNSTRPGRPPASPKPAGQAGAAGSSSAGGGGGAPSKNSSSGAAAAGSSDDKLLVIAASAAGGAVALSAAVVALVLLRKRALRRQRAQHGRRGGSDDAAITKSPSRPLQLHADA